MQRSRQHCTAGINLRHHVVATRLSHRDAGQRERLLPDAGRPGQWEVSRRSESISDVLADPATPQALAPDSSGSWPRELSPKVNSHCPQATATGATPISAGHLSCGTWWLRQSSRSSRGAGASRSQVASPTAAISTNRALARSGCNLAMRGDDVAVGGVGTYSTLGHLADPVFGSMLGWRETRLVGTIFHELAHEQLYVPGDSEFNEAFASVVEEEGIRRWLVHAGRDGGVAAFEMAADARDGVLGLTTGCAGTAGTLYGSGVSQESMRVEKQREFGRLEIRVRAVARALGRVRRLRQLVRAIAEQCAPGVGRHLSRLHARTAPGTRAGAIDARFLRPRGCVGQIERRRPARRGLPVRTRC